MEPSVVEDLLSDESKRKRYLRRAVNLQNTIISWMLETTSNYTAWLAYWCYGDVRIILWSDIICCFVIIPSSYIVNTDAFKSYLLASQWYTSFIDRFRTNRVHPVENEGVQIGIPRNDVRCVAVVAEEIPSSIANEFISRNK